MIGNNILIGADFVAHLVEDVIVHRMRFLWTVKYIDRYVPPLSGDLRVGSRMNPPSCVMQLRTI